MVPRRYLSPVLLVSVVVIATSGLVYELLAGTLASYLLGDSVTQFSLVIGLYLFAMGMGSYLSRFIEHQLLARFVEVELAVALVGGISAPLLFAVYHSLGAFRFALYALVLVLGTLVGLEIPLLIRLLRFQLKLKDLVARVLSLDYVGALVASLLFPVVLVPQLGIHRTSLCMGLLNAAVAFVATFFLPLVRATRVRLRTQCALIALVLGVGVLAVDRVLLAGEATYYGAPVIYAAQSPYQRIVVTQSRTVTRLFLNGNLQFSSDDEYRYHEVLVHPAVAALGRPPVEVLILGGGDGLAARELLRYPSIERIVLVDLDRAVTDLFRTQPFGLRLNQGSLLDKRVEIHNEDAYQFLQESSGAFDLAVVDFPDPSNYAVGKLYTLSFYELLRQHLGMRGVAVVQATSPYYARESFWSIVATIEAAQFHVLPLHVHVPSFGDWGYVLAGGPGLSEPTAPRGEAGALKFLDAATMPELFAFPRDISRVPAPVNRLNDQQLVATYVREWGDWAR